MTETPGVYSPKSPVTLDLDSQTKFSDFARNSPPGRIPVDTFAPTYHPDYLSQIPIWNYIHDLYHGADSWLELGESGFTPTAKTAQFIPRHVAESYENWVSRINATFYDHLFSKAVRRFIDFIFQPGVRWSGESPEFFKDYVNIGLHGITGESFFSAAALSAMLYGHTYILVDFPSMAARNYAEYLVENFRPYWIEIKPQNLVNWDTEIFQGKEVFTYAVVRVSALRSLGQTKIEVSDYYVYRVGSWSLYHEIEPYDGKHFAVVGTGETGLNYIPLVPIFGGYSTGFCSSLPPLRSLADMNRTLYQLTSDHFRKMSLCCHPVPVLKDLMRGDEPLEIGPNSFIQLRDPGGSFSWKEPLATSLEQSRKDINDLRAVIAADSATYLTTPSDRQSALATQLQTSPLESSLASFIRSFSTGINKAIQIHHDYLGLTTDLQVILDCDVFPNAEKDAQGVFAIQGLYTSGLLGRKSALGAIAELGLLGPNFNLDEELTSDDRYTVGDTTGAAGTCGFT